MYPLFPWLSMMCLGWAFGRYLNGYLSGQGKQLPPQALLLITGLLGLLVFAVVRYLNGYGNMFLLREDNSWMQYLQVSKYPPSLSFTAGQLGLFCIILAGLITIDTGLRPDGDVFLSGSPNCSGRPGPVGRIARSVGSERNIHRDRNCSCGPLSDVPVVSKLQKSPPHRMGPVRIILTLKKKRMFC
jgi:hypothetical protein